MRVRFATVAVLLGALQFFPSPLEAQGLGDRLKRKAKEAAEKLDKKAEDKADEAVDKLSDCLFTDAACIRNARAEGKTVTLKDESGTPVDAKGVPVTKSATPAAPEASASVATPPAAAFANFDFVPGNKVLFADDLSRDRVGNFPQRLELVSGNLEIIEWQGARWIRAVAENSRFDVPLPQVLPQRFTMEFDIAIQEDRLIYQNVHAASPKESGDPYSSLDGGTVSEDLPSTALFISQFEAGLGGGGGPTAKKKYEGSSNGNDDNAGAGKIFRVRLQADGRYVKMYVNQDRVANIPNGNFGRTNKLRFSLNATTEKPVYVGNFTVAAGGSQLYDALLSNGRVATQGIFFDTGRDIIRPESGATLKLIGDMLKEHADLKLMIEGHTDNVGSAASNKMLSDKRAAAVKAYLTANYGIEASRLSSSGLGDTKPASPNTTLEGRQQNRRVELVKL